MSISAWNSTANNLFFLSSDIAINAPLRASENELDTQYMLPIKECLIPIYNSLATGFNLPHIRSPYTYKNHITLPESGRLTFSASIGHSIYYKNNQRHPLDQLEHFSDTMTLNTLLDRMMIKGVDSRNIVQPKKMFLNSLSFLPEGIVVDQNKRHIIDCRFSGHDRGSYRIKLKHDCSDGQQFKLHEAVWEDGHRLWQTDVLQLGETHDFRLSLSSFHKVEPTTEILEFARLCSILHGNFECPQTLKLKPFDDGMDSTPEPFRLTYIKKETIREVLIDGFKIAITDSVQQDDIDDQSSRPSMRRECDIRAEIGDSAIESVKAFEHTLQNWNAFVSSIYRMASNRTPLN